MQRTYFVGDLRLRGSGLNTISVIDDIRPVHFLIYAFRSLLGEHLS
jgi:hypothetical protein